MFRQQLLILINFLIIADGVVVILCGYLTHYLVWSLSGGTWAMPTSLFFGVTLFLILLNCFILDRMGFYSQYLFSPLEDSLKRIPVAVIIGMVALNQGLYLIDAQHLEVSFFLIYAGSMCLGLLLVRLAFGTYIRSQGQGYGVRRILLVGSADRVRMVQKALSERRGWGHLLVGWLRSDGVEAVPELPMLGDIYSFEKVVLAQEVDEVVFALPQGSPINLASYIALCEKVGLTTRILPAMFRPGSGYRHLTVEHIREVPTLTMYGTNVDATGLFYKRIMDLIGGLIGGLLLAAMYPFIAIAIKLDSSGPIFFKQRRVGQNNRVFKLYKFRSMYIDAEQRKAELMAKNKMSGCMFKLDSDPRVTRVGRFLRKTSLDEFPQFINVLRGEMSLVGTRPPTPDEVEKYDLWHRRRISMKPGITGFWQVSGRNKITDFDQVVKLDLAYIDNWSLSRDVGILLKTVLVVFTGRGAC